MRKTYTEKSWNAVRAWSRRSQRELVIDVGDQPFVDSPDCFTVRPRTKLNRFRHSISSTRLTHRGWYKRYAKKIALQEELPPRLSSGVFGGNSQMTVR